MFILNILCHTKLEATQQSYTITNHSTFTPTISKGLTILGITSALLITTFTAAEPQSEKSTDSARLADQIEKMNKAEFLCWLKEKGAHVPYIRGLSCNDQPSQPTPLSEALKNDQMEKLEA